MLLLFTLLPVSKCDKGTLLLKYDTDKGDGELIGSKLLSINKRFKSTSGLVYSGNHLCVGVQSNEGNDYIAFLNTYTEQCGIFQCKCSKSIGNIISLFPGKLYLDSQDTNSISCIDFDPVNLSYFEDGIHYVLSDKDNYKIKSLCNYKSTWFLALQSKRKIVDLTNDRIVFSDIDDPCCIFFNSNHRLCFIERGRNLIHCGNDIFKVDDDPTAAIEDDKKGGYWIVCGTNLYFLDYEGELIDLYDLSKWGKEYHNIVEAKGRFI